MRTTRRSTLALAAAATCAAFVVPVTAAQADPAPAAVLTAVPTAGTPAPAGAAAAIGALGGTFEQNAGQAPEEVAFRSRFGALTVDVTDSGDLVKALPGGGVVTASLVGGAQAPALAGEQRLPGTVNYVGGLDATGIATFGRVRADEVYPGVDQVFRPGGDGAVAYDFEVAPGADPEQVVQRFSGVESLRIVEDGSLRLAVTGGGELTHTAPVSYQDVDGVRTPVASSFVVVDDAAVRFEVGAYDRDLPLVVDPTLLESTYLTASPANVTLYGANAVGPDGSVYVAGWDISTPTGSFRPAQAPFQGANQERSQFVAKLT